QLTQWSRKSGCTSRWKSILAGGCGAAATAHAHATMSAISRVFIAAVWPAAPRRTRRSRAPRAPVVSEWACGSFRAACADAQILPQLPRVRATLAGNMTTAISRFPVPALADLPEDIHSRILAVQEKAGFVPNVFLAWAHRPEEFRAFFAYHDALLEKDGGLTKAEREMIVVATSALNHCHYCVIAHGAILRIRAKQPLLADQVAINYLNADLTPRQ